MDNNGNVAVLGGGLSGLVTAVLLLNKGYSVTLIEKNKQTGGFIETVQEQSFLFERGSNFAIESTPNIENLLNVINFSDELLYANEGTAKRFIVRNNRLFSIPSTPQSIVKSDLFTFSGKIRALFERFIPKSKSEALNIADFMKKRFGKQVFDYVYEPLAADAYAGDAEKLSLKYAFPKLYELEQNFGSITRGVDKSIKEIKQTQNGNGVSGKIFSFKGGMQSLIHQLNGQLRNNILLLSDVTDIKKENGKFTIHYNNVGTMRQLQTDAVVSALPAYAAAEALSDIDEVLSESHLTSIHYPPMMFILLAFQKKFIRQPIDGYSFIVPKPEDKSFYSVISTSELFPDRAPKDIATYTVFLGGCRDEDIVEKELKDVIKQAATEVRQTLKIISSPIYSAHRLRKKSIPQYNVGHEKHEEYFNTFEKNNPGMFLTGNYRGGVTFGDCIDNAYSTSEKVDTFFKKQNK